jgi:hypothetical protein
LHGIFLTLQPSVLNGAAGEDLLVGTELNFHG